MIWEKALKINLKLGKQDQNMQITLPWYDITGPKLESGKTSAFLIIVSLCNQKITRNFFVRLFLQASVQQSPL